MTWLEGVACWWLLTPPLTVGLAVLMARHSERQARKSTHGPVMWSSRDELLFRVECIVSEEQS
jgi:hypothetical protein